MRFAGYSTLLIPFWTATAPRERCRRPLIPTIASRMKCKDIFFTGAGTLLVGVALQI
jgi:hypothetical protein